MKKTNWQLLNTVVGEDAHPLRLPEEFIAVIADELEDAFSATSQATALELRDHLSHLLDEMLEIAPDEVHEALHQDEHSDNPTHIAYRLGQINFAQLLASQVCEHKASDELFAAIRSSSYSGYLDALRKQELTNTELAERTGEWSETVSRKLKFLRGLGVTEFRRDGKNVVNFLTPAARTLLSQVHEPHFEAQASAEVIDEVGDMLKKMAEPFRQHMSFAKTLDPSTMLSAL